MIIDDDEMLVLYLSPSIMSVKLATETGVVTTSHLSPFSFVLIVKLSIMKSIKCSTKRDAAGNDPGVNPGINPLVDFSHQMARWARPLVPPTASPRSFAASLTD